MHLYITSQQAEDVEALIETRLADFGSLLSSDTARRDRLREVATELRRQLSARGQRTEEGAEAPRHPADGLVREQAHPGG